MDEKGILVIDSDEQFHMALQTAFSEKPIRFVFNKDTTEAIVALAVEAPDMVIVSLDYPNGSGVAALANIRGFNPDVPIIVTTTRATKEQLLEARKAHAMDFLLKPADMERLVARVSSKLWVTEEMIAATQAAAELEAQKKKEGKPGEKAPEAPPAPPPPEPQFVEAIPKGAELALISEVIPGMKVARVVEKGGVVYIDKGVILKDEHLRLLNKLGIPEICVYTDIILKKRALELKKRLLSQSRITPASVMVGAKPSAQDMQSGQKVTVFAKVKRADIRVPVNVIATARLIKEDGEEVEYKGIIDDVSGGGCAFLSKEVLQKDDEFYLNFDLGNFPMVDVKAVVRHCTRRGTDQFPFRTGFLYMSVTEKLKEKLITKLFQIQRDQKKQEAERRERYGKRPSL